MRNSIASAPGYGRINFECGSLDYQIELGETVLDTISRRDIADELRNLTNRSSVQSDEEIAAFDKFMDDPESVLSDFDEDDCFGAAARADVSNSDQRISSK